MRSVIAAIALCACNADDVVYTSTSGVHYDDASSSGGSSTHDGTSGGGSSTGHVDAGECPSWCGGGCVGSPGLLVRCRCSVDAECKDDLVCLWNDGPTGLCM